MAKNAFTFYRKLKRFQNLDPRANIRLEEQLTHNKNNKLQNNCLVHHNETGRWPTWQIHIIAHIKLVAATARQTILNTTVDLSKSHTFRLTDSRILDHFISHFLPQRHKMSPERHDLLSLACRPFRKKECFTKFWIDIHHSMVHKNNLIPQHEIAGMFQVMITKCSLVLVYCVNASICSPNSNAIANMMAGPHWVNRQDRCSAGVEHIAANHSLRRPSWS